MLVSAHVRPDGTLLMEGAAGIAIATAPGPVEGVEIAHTRAQFREGWRATARLEAAGYRIVAADFDPVSAGELIAGYALIDGTLIRQTEQAPPAVLTRPRISAFIRFAGLGDLYAAAVGAAAASADPIVVYAADVLTQGAEYHFDVTLSAAGAALSALDLGETPVPDFADPATRSALRAAWDAAASLELPV